VICIIDQPLVRSRSQRTSSRWHLHRSSIRDRFCASCRFHSAPAQPMRGPSKVDQLAVQHAGDLIDPVRPIRKPAIRDRKLWPSVPSAKGNLARFNIYSPQIVLIPKGLAAGGLHSRRAVKCQSVLAVLRPEAAGPSRSTTLGPCATTVAVCHCPTQARPMQPTITSKPLRDQRHRRSAAPLSGRPGLCPA